LINLNLPFILTDGSFLFWQATMPDEQPPTIDPEGSTSTTSFAEKDLLNQDDALEQNLRFKNEVSELARRLTNTSHTAPGTLFPVQPDSSLDPDSSMFDARAWAKGFLDLRTRISGGNPPRTTGIAWTNLNAYGFGSATGFQENVGNVFLNGANIFNNLFHREQQRVDILRDLEGVVQSGEMLAVLGPPGSGCSTLLRTIAGDTYGFHVDANINYSGIPPKEMSTAFRGEAIYTAEVDDHFPHLTVGDTLYFAAQARSPKNIPEGVSRAEYAEHLRDVIMAMFGISHTKNTRVGDQYIRGVSGGERKRVTIAEAALGHAPLQCWDNSTRGLDSANAIEFCRALRTQADIMGTTSCVALYQAPQTAYEVSSPVH
jgi:ABC-type multidrug transport system ATPase subunit